MARKLNLEIKKGATFRHKIRVLDGTPRGKVVTVASVAQDIAASVLTPRNLTGCTFSAKVQKVGSTDATGKITLAVTLDATDLTNSTLQLYLSAAQTTSIAFATGNWDLAITYPGGDKSVECEGTVAIQKVVAS